MSKILTQEEIDSLLKDVTSIPLPDEAESKAQNVHLYDFKHPDRISKDQLRALRTIHDAFARSFGTYLSSTLRTLVDINMLSIDQATYSEYMLSLSVPSCIYIVASSNLKGSAILEITPQFGLMMVDRLLGGSGQRVGSIRELTMIEQNILRKMVESALTTLTDTWRHVYRYSLYIESFESNPQFVQIAPSSETAVVISFEIVIRDATFPMNICFPYFVLEPLIQNLSASWSTTEPKTATTSEIETLKERVKLTKLPLVAQLGSARLKTKDILGLKKGDLIVLNEKHDQNMKIWIDGKIKLWGNPGISNLRKAIKIVRRVSDEEEIIHE